MNSPEMTYHVGGLLERTLFTLAATQVIITRRAVLGNNFEMPFRYSDIDPLPFKLGIRRAGASAAVGIGAIAAASALPIWSSASLHLSDFVLLICLGVVLVSGLLGLVFLPLRVEATAFRNKSGGWLFSIRR